MTYEEFVTLAKLPSCHYCAVILKRRSVFQAAYLLDRKDNTRPYTFDNCVPCCSRCNRGKCHLFSYEEWVEIGKTIRQIREKNEEQNPSSCL